MRQKTNSIYYLISFLLLALPSPGLAAHGISIDGKLKYPAGFSHFDYTSEKARVGGDLVLHDLGSFDKMNPYTLKGTSPSGLQDLVFETLATPSLDEPFAEYGLLAKDIELAADGLSVTYSLDPRATFSDGTPVTAEDVKFSLDTLKSDLAHPFYSSYFQDIKGAKIIDPHKVVFLFRRKNRELHLIASQMPVFSRKFYQKIPFDRQDMTPPVGSGPYVVDDVRQGESIRYKRNPKYWGKDLPVRRNMFNFDTITYKYFKDQVVSVEAFKAQEFDFMPINIAKQWARDLTGPKFEQKILIKKMLPHHNDQGMQGFVFNTRRKIFTDRRVRRALGLAFDFEWTNTTLFFDQYTPSDSYFSNSPLDAKGLPTGKELALLEPYRDQLPPEVFTTPLTPVSTAPPHSLRGNLRLALKLLHEAGWRAGTDGILINGAGEPLTFEILLVSPSFERVIEPYATNLQKLGVNVSYRTIDPALYTRRLQDFDFDMIVNVWGESQSPGNEQRDYWSSAAADRKGSRNYAGIKNPVVDALVNKIIYATSQTDLTAACKALDRVLWYGYYVVPNWYLPYHRIAYRNIFARPETLPLYYTPFQELMTWWMK
ncbi:MAG: extracellular solute-binding protein [Deltaproteobacteria bacterium]